MNFNTLPYNDDFDPNKNFYRVLFKPGVAVQARELNQLQSIIQHQVATLGGHIFKNNSILSGGALINNTADILQVNINSNIDVTTLLNKTITNDGTFSLGDPSTITGVTAIVLAVQPKVGSNPALLYVKYQQSDSTSEPTVFTFANSSTLYTVESSSTSFQIDSSTVGKVCVLDDSVYYTKEVFVRAPKQYLILEKSSGPSVVTNRYIFLKIVESTVTSDDDSSLLDNSTGYPNEFAPGADRYMIDLVLTDDLITTPTDIENQIPVARIENNIVTYLNNNSQYDDIMKMIAQRTYDTNGNFTVNGLNLSLSDYPSNPLKIACQVDSGKCYLGGYAYEQQNNIKILIDKPRDVVYFDNTPVSKSSGFTLPYLYIANDFTSSSETYPCVLPQPGSLIQLVGNGFSGLDFDHPQRDSFVDYFMYSPTSVVGHAIYRAIENVESNTSSLIFKLILDQVFLRDGYSVEDIGGVRFLNNSTVDIVDNPPVITYEPTSLQPVSSVIHGVSVLHEFDIQSSTDAQTLSSATVEYLNSAGELLRSGKVYSINADSTKAYFIKNSTVPTPQANDAIAKHREVLYLGATGVPYQSYTALSGATSAQVIAVGPDSNGVYYGQVKIAVSDIPSTVSIVPGRSSIKGKFDVFSTGERTQIISTVTKYETDTDTNYKLIQFGPLTEQLYANIKPTGTLKLRTFESSLTVGNKFVSNYSPNLTSLIEVSDKTIHSLHDDGDNATVSYRDVQSFTQICSIANSSYTCTIANSATCFDFNTKYYYAYIVDDEEFVTLTESEITVDDSLGFFTLNVGGINSRFYGKTVTVYAVVLNTNVNESIRTENTESIVIPLVSGAWTALKNTNVTGITEIYDGKTANINTTSWGVASDGLGTLTFNCTYVNSGAGAPAIAINDTVVVEGVDSNEDLKLTDSRFDGMHKVSSVTITQSNSTTYIIAVSVKYNTNPNANGNNIPNTDGILKLVPVESDVKVTNKFDFDSGATKNSIGVGMIKLKQNTIRPNGQLLVVYTYYDGGDQSNYYSVDSYGDWNSSDLGYIGEIPDIDNATSKIKLRQCIDFRQATQPEFIRNRAKILSGGFIELLDLNLSGLANLDFLKNTVVVGNIYGALFGLNAPALISENAVYTNDGVFNKLSSDGNTVLDPIVDCPSGKTSPGLMANLLRDKKSSFMNESLSNAEMFIGLGASNTGFKAFDPVTSSDLACPLSTRNVSYDYTQFKSKQTLVYLDRDSNTNALSIKTKDNPDVTNIEQRQTPWELPLALIKFDPYTVDVTDVSFLKTYKTPVYRMIDINNLKRQVDNNTNEILALNQPNTGGESDSLVYGFWIENFTTITRPINHGDFRCTLYNNAYVAPISITKSFYSTLDDNSNASSWKQTGNYITLNYSTSRFIGNDKASTYHNLNPFNSLQWNGTVALVPNHDIDDTSNFSNERVVEITNLKAAWGPDTQNGKHAITFDWKTSTGRTGRVNTDKHLSKALGGKYDGTYATSLINKNYNDVKEYLNAGRPFDFETPLQIRATLRGSRRS